MLVFILNPNCSTTQCCEYVSPHCQMKPDCLVVTRTHRQDIPSGRYSHFSLNTVVLPRVRSKYIMQSSISTLERGQNFIGHGLIKKEITGRSYPTDRMGFSCCCFSKMHRTEDTLNMTETTHTVHSTVQYSYCTQYGTQYIWKQLEVVVFQYVCRPGHVTCYTTLQQFVSYIQVLCYCFCLTLCVYVCMSVCVCETRRER